MLTSGRLMEIIELIWDAGTQNVDPSADVEYEEVRRYLVELPNTLEKAHKFEYLEFLGVNNWEHYQEPEPFFPG